MGKEPNDSKAICETFSWAYLGISLDSGTHGSARSSALLAGNGSIAKYSRFGKRNELDRKSLSRRKHGVPHGGFGRAAELSIQERLHPSPRE